VGESDRRPPAQRRVGPRGGIADRDDTRDDRRAVVDECQVPILAARHHLHRSDRFRCRAHLREVRQQCEHPLPCLFVAQHTQLAVVGCAGEGHAERSAVGGHDEQRHPVQVNKSGHGQHDVIVDDAEMPAVIHEAELFPLLDRPAGADRTQHVRKRRTPAHRVDDDVGPDHLTAVGQHPRHVRHSLDRSRSLDQ
jgi:hypothetical protein